MASPTAFWRTAWQPVLSLVRSNVWVAAETVSAGSWLRSR